MLSKLISLIELMLVARALLSWVPNMSRSPIYDILYQLTEPFIFPVRKLCDHFRIGQGYMFDIPFIATFLLLGLLQRLFYALLIR